MINKMSNIIDNITSGIVIRTDSNGKDVDYPNITGLLENSLYIRLVSSDNKVLHISAFEIDKALSIISGMSNNKVDKTELDALIEQLNGKASSVQLSMLEDFISNKADKSYVDEINDIIVDKADKSTVNTLINTVDNKADKSTVDTLINTVYDKADKSTVDTLINTVDDKADKNELVKLKQDLTTLENTLNSLSDNATISTITAQINYLNNEIQKRLTIDDLNRVNTNTSNLSNKLDNNIEKIENINKELINKASISFVQKEVNELHNALTAFTSQVKNKADKVELSSKASQSDVNLLVQRINNINSLTTEELSKLNKCCDEIQNDIDKKISKSLFDSTTNELSEEINKKANKEEVRKNIEELTKQINSIDIDTPIQSIEESIHNIETSFNNTISTVRSLVNTHDRQIQQQNTQISKLQEKDNKLELAANNEWVRVMTPEEYNRLSNNPNYADGSKNPYAKQPNTIYMLVRYNKPIAVYIGTVLIAEAKQDGSVGFAYEFPIIF